MQRRRRGNYGGGCGRGMKCSAGNLCVYFHTWGESHAALNVPLEYRHSGFSAELTHKEEIKITGAILEGDKLERLEPENMHHLPKWGSFLPASPAWAGWGE